MPPRARLRSVASSASTHALGVAFEIASLDFLRKAPLSLELAHVGGAGDGGIDLRGWWIPPNFLRTLMAPNGKATEKTATFERGRYKVICQCKAESRKLGPRALRELEGTVIAQDELQKETKATPTIAMLVSQSGFSAATVQRARSSSLPLSLVHLAPIYHPPLDHDDPDTDGETRVEEREIINYSCVSLSINQALQDLLGSQVELRWKPEFIDGRRVLRPLVNWTESK